MRWGLIFSAICLLVWMAVISDTARQGYVDGRAGVQQACAATSPADPIPAAACAHARQSVSEDPNGLAAFSRDYTWRLLIVNFIVGVLALGALYGVGLAVRGMLQSRGMAAARAPKSAALRRPLSGWMRIWVVASALFWLATAIPVLSYVLEKAYSPSVTGPLPPEEYAAEPHEYNDKATVAISPPPADISPQAPSERLQVRIDRAREKMLARAQGHVDDEVDQMIARSPRLQRYLADPNSDAARGTTPAPSGTLDLLKPDALFPLLLWLVAPFLALMLINRGISTIRWIAKGF